MATPAQVAGSWHAGQARIAKAAALAAVREWRTLDAKNLNLGWLAVALRLLAILTGAQRRAAGGAQGYVARVLAAQGVTPAAGYRLLPDAFGGVASDGRGLETLLYSPVVRARQLMGQGVSISDAMTRAEADLVMLTRTQVQDSGRMAVQAAMTADPAVAGWIRVVNLPSCPRCIILAGRWYKYSAAFQRHPSCDCGQMPAAEVIKPQDPGELIAKMREDYPAKLRQSLTEGDLKALDHGADLNQVVNAHRGMATAAGTTLEGTAKRGLAGHRLHGRARMTPALIFDEAGREGWPRQKIVAELMRAGYLT